MEVKYLRDGRKVAVISRVNKQDSIVQEMFVTEDGTEIPSGEQFVTKSLLDAPLETVKDRKEKHAEARLEIVLAEIRGLEKQHKKAEQELHVIREIVRSSKRFAELLPEADLDVFASFLTGTIEYLVMDGYRITPPTKIIDKVVYWESYYGERRFDALKLVSVLGASKGELKYRIHNYSDGSGSSNKVYPFTTLYDALSHIKARAEKTIEKSDLSKESFEACIKMGIVFSDHSMAKYKEARLARIDNNISSLEDSISKEGAKLEMLKEDRNTTNNL